MPQEPNYLICRFLLREVGVGNGDTNGDIFL